MASDILKKAALTMKIIIENGEGDKRGIAVLIKDEN